MSALDIAKARLAARAGEGIASLNSFISSPGALVPETRIHNGRAYERNETNELNNPSQEPIALEARAAPRAPTPIQAPPTPESAPAGGRTSPGEEISAPSSGEVEDWPASAWQRLHRAALEFWGAPRRDAFGSVTRYAPGIAARLAFSELCDTYRRRYLGHEKDGGRARIEAARALGAFSITPPVGWEP